LSDGECSGQSNRRVQERSPNWKQHQNIGKNISGHKNPVSPGGWEEQKTTTEVKKRIKGEAKVGGGGDGRKVRGCDV